MWLSTNFLVFFVLYFHFAISCTVFYCAAVLVVASIFVLLRLHRSAQGCTRRTEGRERKRCGILGRVKRALCRTQSSDLWAVALFRVRWSSAQYTEPWTLNVCPNSTLRFLDSTQITCQVWFYSHFESEVNTAKTYYYLLSWCDNKQLLIYFVDSWPPDEIPIFTQNSSVFVQ